MKSVKDTRTLAEVAIGELCKLHELGGKWRVIAQEGDKRTVQNTISGQELVLPKGYFLQK